MTTYPYALETGSKKFTCPRCGARNRFRRVIDTYTGLRLPDHVGRCDRESSCGYEYTWTRYLTENVAATGNRGSGANSRKNGDDRLARTSTYCYLKPEHLRTALGGYDRNAFVNFLFRLFPDDPEVVVGTLRDYLIGTSEGYTVFPTVDGNGRICKAKLIRFDPLTGKRRRTPYSISSLPAKLRAEGVLSPDFTSDKSVFFGEHLLSKYPRARVGIVEAEKTAVIASNCRRIFPNFIWLATGSKRWLNVKRLRRLGRDRSVLVYPDSDGYAEWSSIVNSARSVGLNVRISEVIEMKASNEEKKHQTDLADYLILEQQERNDPVNQACFTDLVEERKAILTFDGLLSEEAAQDFVESSGFLEFAERTALIRTS